MRILMLPLVLALSACSLTPPLVKPQAPVPAIARGFHDALTDGIVHVVQTLAAGSIVLTGGCFQNTLLVEQTLRALRARGYRVYRHCAVPPNDGGIAVGQAWFRPRREATPCV